MRVPDQPDAPTGTDSSSSPPNSFVHSRGRRDDGPARRCTPVAAGGHRQRAPGVRDARTLTLARTFEDTNCLRGFLITLLHRRMEARHQRRLFPAVRRDLGRNVSTGESIWEQADEERVQLRVREPRPFLAVHARRLSSSSVPDQVAGTPPARCALHRDLYGAMNAVMDVFCTVKITRTPHCDRPAREHAKLRSPAHRQPGSSLLLRHTDVNDPERRRRQPPGAQLGSFTSVCRICI